MASMPRSNSSSRDNSLLKIRAKEYTSKDTPDPPRPRRIDPNFRNRLRQKFIEQAKSYIGIPYSKKYHPEGTEYHNSPLFLDCCGLVRRCVYDLKDEFGFALGRWNQAYQYDVLPFEIKFEQMQPGDLIFYSAKYYDNKRKKQLHAMVHVEIFIGGNTGEGTIASRIQTGFVQKFDSYKFESNRYYDVKHHFKSIEMWLRGVCRSYCTLHSWIEAKKPGTSKRPPLFPNIKRTNKSSIRSRSVKSKKLIQITKNADAIELRTSFQLDKLINKPVLLGQDVETSLQDYEEI
jgi:hypothetical protein